VPGVAVHTPVTNADKLLAPVVQSAVLHPTLGCVAVQRAPPLALRQAANIMQVSLSVHSTDCQWSKPCRRRGYLIYVWFMHGARV
jgi:hypothetical protein